MLRQAGDAALAGAGAEGHQDLRLAPHELGHVFLLAGADAAVEQADVDARSGIFSTSRTLPSAAQGHMTMSKAAATSRIFSSMARMEISQPPQEAAQ